MPKLLFITGAHKTGTSSVLGMLNCSNDIYLEFELFGHPKYPAKLLANEPSAEVLFRHNSRLEFYKEFSSYVKTMPRVNDVKYTGEKFATLAFDPIEEVKDQLIIYTIRDIRTWLAKEVSLTDVYPNLTWCEMAYEYTRTFLKTFAIGSNCYMLKMEDVVGRNDIVRGRLSKFLEMPQLKNDMNYWWKKVGKWGDKNPKSYSIWWSGHRSSKVKPRAEDVTVEITDYPFWDTLLPIFDKYYARLNAKFEPEEVEQDLEKLEILKGYYDVDMSDLYVNVKNKRLF